MYVYGKNVAKELLNNKKKINKCYLVDTFNDYDIKKLLDNSKIKYTYLSKKEMDNKVEGLHQGIILDIDNYIYTPLEELLDKDLIVILDHIEDPHNFGAIIRTCEASNVGGIIIPKDRNVDVNGTVMKTSAGTVDKVKICMVPNLIHAIKTLKDNNFWIVGTDLDGTNYTKIDYNMKTAIIIGNEGKGISDLVKKNCDFIATIPMLGTINSLNASVAAGILIYRIVTSRE